ncbi:cilia- and flagella-associated protein 45 [Lucilia sericata]|uniref:cilia- and flagella-associated protein 45 n=1 Tax=Lucilia sericata TaxID=13632 RepID=UPI0018A80BDC|nr:cilia- and flagella-associated protein 45 [Lucilia sericata]
MPCFSAYNRRSYEPLLGDRPVPRAKTAGRSGAYTSQGAQKESAVRTGNAVKRNRFKIEKKVALPVQEFNRLKTAAKVLTLEDRLNALMLREQEMKRLEEETERTKQYFKQIDEARKKKEEENSRDIEGQEPNEQLKVLERAFLAKHEQEEEVKKANRIILDAKCHAVRDAQVQEKYELQKELRKDEQRLEKQVIDRAKKALSEEDAKYERLHEEKQKYAHEIKKQLNERENARFLEAERIEEEAIMLRKANEAIKRDEERQAKLAKERRLKYRDDLAKVVEMSTTFRRMLCEQEREAEMRIAAYMRAKEERMKALQAEQKLAKEELERKQQRIYNLAEKILQSKSDREEMSYLREQERIEREYRRKEKEAAMRKKQIEKELAEARERQMQETKHRQALQIARAEQEFNTLIDTLKEAEAKQKREDELRECRRKCYRRDIIQQIGDNEMKRRSLQELEKNQASAWRESERQRDANIRAVITAKLNAMREACLPDKYIKDVEKQLSRIVGKDKTLPKLAS